MRPVLVAVAMVALTMQCGCVARNLVFTTYTKVGVDISGTNNEPPNAVFGYKRFEGAIIPVDIEHAQGKPEDAMSVYASMKLKNEWFGGLSILQVFATGDAAVASANNPEGFAAVLNPPEKPE